MFFKRKAYYLFIGFFSLIGNYGYAQDQLVADSLEKIYHSDTVHGEARLELLRNLSFNETNNYSLALQYAEELIKLSGQYGNDTYLFHGYYQKGNARRLLGEPDKALEAYFKSAEIAGKGTYYSRQGSAYSAIADIYTISDNYKNAMLYYHKAIAILQKSKDSVALASCISNAGDAFRRNKDFDSALLYFRESGKIFEEVNYLPGKAYNLGNIGMVYASLGQNNLAENNINEAISILEKSQDYYPICVYLISMSDVYLSNGNWHTAANYALRSLSLAEKYGLKEQIADADLKLSELYEKSGDISRAFKYYKDHITYRDSFNNIKSVQKMADLRTAYEVSKKQVEVDLLSQQKRNQRNIVVYLAIILGLAIITLFTLLKNNRNKQKAYKILSIQKQETEAQKAKTEKALNELQLTQRQLIQAEKMASLGELTAGIAHEIQNPLNFVNNFSEVSSELLTELAEETLNKLSAAEKVEAEEIINDLADNLKKISHHGKRADAIVKGMLQHSRTSAGKKELTDINPLLEEYLRLSYHVFRSKDNAFDIAIETNFESNIKELMIVAQDIGRVLLNMYNNAFYSLQQKIKLGLKDYEPKLLLTTKDIAEDGKLIAVQIRIKDNGAGIPDKILNKIYQPFFTTKPAGQGTGLGLYLSYDIIVNEHQGQIKLETKEGEYAEFIIELPNNKR